MSEKTSKSAPAPHKLTVLCALSVSLGLALCSELENEGSEADDLRVASVGQSEPLQSLQRRVQSLEGRVETVNRSFSGENESVEEGQKRFQQSAGEVATQEFVARLHNVFANPSTLFTSLKQDFPNIPSDLHAFLLVEPDTHDCSDKEMALGRCRSVEARMAAIDLLEGLGALETPESADTAQHARQVLERLVATDGENIFVTWAPEALRVAAADRLDALAALTRLAPHRAVWALRHSQAGVTGGREKDLAVFARALTNLDMPREQQALYLTLAGARD